MNSDTYPSGKTPYPINPDESSGQSSFTQGDRLSESEEKFYSLLEFAPLAFFQGDRNGNFITVNSKAEELTGYSKKELLTMNMSDLFSVEMLEEKPLKYGAVDSGEVIVTERKITTKAGNTVVVEMSSKVMADKTYQSFMKDITELKRAEEAIKSNYYLLLAAAETAKFGSWSLDIAESRVKWSDEVANIHGMPQGYSPSLTEGINFYAPEWVEKIKSSLNGCISRGIPFDEEMQIISLQGNRVWVRVTGKAVSGQNGEVVSLQGSFQNISDRKLAEQSLLESESHLRKLNAMKDKFFSIIAHDIKGPFSAIIGLSNLLVDQIKEKDYKGSLKYAETILNSSQGAMDLMKNLLEWSRLHTGQLKFAPLYIDVAALINESAELLNKSARQKSVTISVELPHSLIFFADTAMMSTILKNLISNAVKYTYPGGQIVIRAEMKAAELLVSVVDNGIGISKENQEKLFRMEDIPSVVGTQNEKGTGLGLLLCKELVEEHGGRIWVKSQPGEGSTFSFSIPKAQ